MFEKENVELEHARQQLELVNSILSHDIRNNLGVVQAAIEAYLIEGKGDHMPMAERSVKKSLDLLLKMKELISALNSNAPLRTLDPRDTIAKVMASYGMELDVHGEGLVLADNALFSLFDNLVRNAIVHGGAGRIRFDLQTKDGWCTIRIEDNGTGIPDWIKQDIFAEGFTHGRRAGSGIGLFIVQSLVHKYDGTISVEDNVPNGSVFIVKLPSPPE